MSPRSSPCLRTLAVGALALFATACETPPSPDAPRAVPLQAQGDYRHELTGFLFPTRIGPYVRTQLAAYDASARDVAARYELPGAPSGVAILHLYPATADASFPSWDDLDAEFDSARRRDEALVEGGELMSDLEGDALVNGFSLRGRQAVYHVDVEGDERGPVVSSMHLYAIENWYLEFRFGHPEHSSSEVRWLERDFLASVRWPLPGEPRPAPTPACIELANRYEQVARLQDRGLSREEQMAWVADEVGDADEDRRLRTTSMNAISVSESHPELTSFQIRKLVLDDCVEDAQGRPRLERLWSWELEADPGEMD